jgi:protein-S-isoprenylcysteine O-methyltransferase Ste14
MICSGAMAEGRGDVHVPEAGVERHGRKAVLALRRPHAQISSALFLASLSPSRFRLGWLCSVRDSLHNSAGACFACLLYGYLSWRFAERPAAMDFSNAWVRSRLVVALFWGAAQDRCRAGSGVSFCAVMGGLTLWACFSRERTWALTFAECANLLMTALLLLFVSGG